MGVCKIKGTYSPSWKLGARPLTHCKVAIMGAGAVGSMLGGLIKYHSPSTELVLIGRGDHGIKLNERGYVVLDGPLGTRNVPARFSGDFRDVGGSDYVLFTVKSYDTEQAIRSAAPYLQKAVLISIQNGINHQVLSKFVQADRLVIGLTTSNISIPKPGTVRLLVNGHTMLGPPPGHPPTPAVEQAVELLRVTGLRVDAHPYILNVQHHKLILNSLACAAALSASSVFADGFLFPPWRKAVGNPLFEECLQTLQRAGLHVGIMPGVPSIRRAMWMLRLLAAPVARPVFTVGVRWHLRSKPLVFSLQQDLLRGKKTEVDFINGEFVRLARERLGTAAPYNAIVVDLAHQLEDRGDGSFFSREEVIRKFQELKRRFVSKRVTAQATTPSTGSS